LRTVEERAGRLDKKTGYDRQILMETLKVYLSKKEPK
jgi:hypothetical protein